MRNINLGPVTFNPNRVLAVTTLATVTALGVNACGGPENSAHSAGTASAPAEAPTETPFDADPTTSATPHAEDYEYLPHEELPTEEPDANSDLGENPDTQPSGSSVNKGLDGNTKYCTSARDDRAEPAGNDGEHLILIAHGDCAITDDPTVVAGYQKANNNTAPIVTVPNGDKIVVDCMKMGEEVDTLAAQYTRPGSTRQASSDIWLYATSENNGTKKAYFSYAELGFPALKHGGVNVTMCE